MGDGSDRGVSPSNAGGLAIAMRGRSIAHYDTDDH